MKSFRFFVLLLGLFVPAAHAVDIEAAIAPSPDYQGEGSEFIISWASLAGKWYNVEAATQLDGNWSTLNPGPIVAQSGEATYRDQTTSSVRFYRVRKLDTEPPEVVRLNPADGAIAVGRQEPLTVQLWDEAGIAWESIAFSTAAGPIIGIGDPRLSFTDNVLTYVPGSGEYYGDYGETVAVTLSVSDKLGYRLENYTWTFRLELEAVLASNVVLIDGASGLTLLSIDGDTYTFSYAGDSPGVSVDNILVSTDQENPYKRRALDIADHPESHTIDILTEAVPLSELFEQGSLRASYALNEQTQVAPLFPANGQALLEGYKIDLTGKVIYEDSHIQVQVTSGAIEFVPEFTIAADLNGLRLTSFDAEVTGTVNFDMTVKATAQISGTYEHSTKLKTFKNVFLQFIGPVPVWEEVVLEFNIGFAAEAEVSGWIEAGFTSSNSLTVGATLRDGSWNTFSRRTGEFSPRTPQWQISGGVKLQAYVEPKLTVYLESLVGPSVNLRPYLDLEGYFQANPFAYDCGLYAGLTSDLAIQLRGWDDDWGELPSWRLLDLRWTLWHESYPRGWGKPTRWYVDDSVPSSGDGSSWGTAFKTIQEGIDASSDGHQVIVATGTYVENIHFKGKNIVLRSTDPFARTTVASTVIDGNRGVYVVTFAGTETQTCALEGFTIQNGAGIYGGTLDGPHTRAAVRQNVVIDNWAYFECGIVNCDGLIEGNWVGRNEVWNWVTGIVGCDGTIRNNVVCLNSGVDCVGVIDCNGVVENNVIVGNQGWCWTGVIVCKGIIRNCIIWGNSEGYQVEDSSIPTYSCIQDWTGGGIGNTSLDPRFIDPDGPDNDPYTYQDNNYRLRADSPCIDAGKNASWMSEAVDLDGNPRIINGRVDMGAYEYKP